MADRHVHSEFERSCHRSSCLSLLWMSLVWSLPGDRLWLSYDVTNDGCCDGSSNPLLTLYCYSLRQGFPLMPKLLNTWGQEAGHCGIWCPIAGSAKTRESWSHSRVLPASPTKNKTRLWTTLTPGSMLKSKTSLAYRLIWISRMSSHKKCPCISFYLWGKGFGSHPVLLRQNQILERRKMHKSDWKMY